MRHRQYQLQIKMRKPDVLYVLFFLCGESPSAAGLSHKGVKACQLAGQVWHFLTHREAPGTAQFSSGKLMDENRRTRIPLSGGARSDTNKPSSRQ